MEQGEDFEFDRFCLMCFMKTSLAPTKVNGGSAMSSVAQKQPLSQEGLPCRELLHWPSFTHDNLSSTSII